MAGRAICYPKGCIVNILSRNIFEIGELGVNSKVCGKVRIWVRGMGWDGSGGSPGLEAR